MTVQAVANGVSEHPVPNGHTTSHARSSRASADIPPLPDLAQLITVSDVRTALTQLSIRSSALNKAIKSNIERSAETIDEAQEGIRALAPQLDLIHDEASILNTRLEATAETARKVSRRIRSLDEEKRRLKIATQWALNTSELKRALIDLSAAIDDADWDSAMRHCSKALSIPDEVVNSRFAASVVPTTELPDDPATTLLKLRTRLLHIFVRAFRRATADKQQADATRFFKLFPQVGWHEEGLRVYSDFANELVQDFGRGLTDSLATGQGAGSSAPFFYSILLTRLFEHMALLVDRHQPLVDKHYGAGSFAAGVMGGLQNECDRLGCKVLRTWKEERKLRRRMDSSRVYRSTFLESLGSSVNLRSGVAIPGRTGTPAGGASAAKAGTAALGLEEDGSDRREVDQTLSEAAAIGATWATYKRFLNGRLRGETKSPPAHDQASDDEDGTGVKDFRKPVATPRTANFQKTNGADAGEQATDVTAATLAVPPIADMSTLGKEVKDMLHEEYVLLETWHLRSSLERAHRIDTSDPSARPLTSSILDDAFFVIRAVLARTLSTSDVDTADAMVTHIKKAIEDDFLQVIHRRLENSYRSASINMAVDGPRKETATREMRTSFVTYLNVLSTSASYAERIVRDLGSEGSLLQLYDEGELPDVSLILRTFGGVSARLRTALRTQLDQLFAQLTRPRLRLVLTEAYGDMSYVLQDDSYAEAEASDQVRRRFIQGWDQVLAIYKDLFEDSNYDLYHSLAIDAIVRPWEKLIIGMRFTELGALRFDKDLRSITAHIAGQTSLGVREKFLRLQQMSFILQLDPSEEDESAYETAAASGMSWRLSASEVQIIRGLRLSG
ncbi:COG4-domain-containing protein [Tilletiaria anomala UBC 951]|uniref:Conserved oligomeric Golgi complex subunit 4 n=1 Tax=Tilletiaria anomala (strain ATCC 24038 / CBS 436.72 / UBC 951) TaxID=1037660 RepID=A0A066W8A3_TILAU|nr:COG4-domain-containing protein [Tilletiaria anomala UBC 951]KDN49956.1 COG4-domain-containing protein [Tilletiaria anomala UBC 951]